jgi:hypothetical protein
VTVSTGGSKAQASTTGCASQVDFYAYDVSENFFGPSSMSPDINAQKSEFFSRLVRTQRWWLQHQSTRRVTTRRPLSVQQRSTHWLPTARPGRPVKHWLSWSCHRVSPVSSPCLAHTRRSGCRRVQAISMCQRSTRLVLRGLSTSLSASTVQKSSSTSSWTVAFSQWLRSSQEFHQCHRMLRHMRQWTPVRRRQLRRRRLRSQVAQQAIAARTPTRVSTTTLVHAHWETAVLARLARRRLLPIQLSRLQPWCPQVPLCHHRPGCQCLSRQLPLQLVILERLQPDSKHLKPHPGLARVPDVGERFFHFICR